MLHEMQQFRQHDADQPAGYADHRQRKPQFGSVVH